MTSRTAETRSTPEYSVVSVEVFRALRASVVNESGFAVYGSVSHSAGFTRAIRVVPPRPSGL